MGHHYVNEYIAEVNTSDNIIIIIISSSSSSMYGWSCQRIYSYSVMALHWKVPMTNCLINEWVETLPLKFYAILLHVTYMRWNQGTHQWLLVGVRALRSQRPFHRLHYDWYHHSRRLGSRYSSHLSVSTPIEYVRIDTYVCCDSRHVLNSGSW